MKFPRYRESYVRRFHPYSRTSPSNHETAALISEAEYQMALSRQPRSSFALPSFMFEGGEIQIVPSAPGSGDAFDVQTPAGRRRMRLMIDYLVTCLDVILRRKREEKLEERGREEDSGEVYL
ncbi:uncharacterized protein STEHIDRAFT_153541 [Stereum hirsutum FP-91666 SS1]|uniref:uncharacterized protein n=1 Tax=Stereum hirsutum (strain FP-91666) TaxID=721885 RepID=UPI000440B21D|nr:uncharacterized protein STEHIDRAFT_153541 [Stereum hirsutum FP-91666 SS1]EIM89697.1 hypothetical protein STEHIDRAFT_153541 [Stereum hirsutum FP-91666 SS1]